MTMRAFRLEGVLQTRRARRPPSHPGTRLWDVSGSILRVRVAGERGPSLVIVPDPPNVIEHYDGLIELLAPHVRVVCVEAPGFGFSVPARDFDYGLARQTAVLAELLTRLGQGPYVLALPCFAGLLAVKLALEKPGLISGLVLVQTPSWEEEMRWVRRVDARRVLQRPWIGQLMMGFGKRSVARGWYRAALPRDADPAPFLGPALEAFEHGACYCLASAFQAAAREAAPGLGPVRQPALVVWGDADRTHRRTDKRSILAYAPHADWAEFEGAGHFPDLEQPERFRDEVLHFVR
jgi:pimeloyl-ACP methyl ester carboxylesterase